MLVNDSVFFHIHYNKAKLKSGPHDFALYNGKYSETCLILTVTVLKYFVVNGGTFLYEGFTLAVITNIRVPL